MIPSMDLFGGWSGFLGSTGTDVGLEPKTLKDLDQGHQTFVETCYHDYASFLRDGDGKDLGPLVKDAKGITGPTVALIGGGIANVIAAYELSRCGVKVTLFEGRQKLGGRMETDPGPPELPPLETGAMKFPVESRVFWHYVRAWATFRCKETEQDPDKILATPYPNPGIVPTQVCYQDEWFDLGAPLRDLPPAMLEAASLWRSFLVGLNDGLGGRMTYLPDIQELTRAAPDPSGVGAIFSFWKAMRARYEHKSLGEVLQTEVFVSRGSEVPNLMEVFGTMGVGTGGFGSLFEIGFLEVLRNVIWNPSGDYVLPRSLTYDMLDEGTAGFVQGLARLAYDEASRFYVRRFEDMFQTGTQVLGIAVDDSTNKVVIVGGGDTMKFDYAIVAISTRAMQDIGLDRDAPGGPFSTSQVHTKESLSAVQSIQAAIHQLNMVSAYKMIAPMDNPVDERGWPLNRNQVVMCFVTDRYPRVTSVMPNVEFPPTQTRAVVTALGNDALKFQAKTVDDQQNSIAGAFYAQDDTRIWPQAVVGGVLKDARGCTFMDWNRRPGVGGGFKLDRPGDSYLSGSLFYHCQLANEEEIRPYSRVFLAGDSVGFMGGWAEGSAMSALNATTAVLTQIAKQAKTKWVVRSADLIAPGQAPFHSWQLMGTGADPLPRLKGMTRVVDCSKDLNKPGSWRYDGGEGCSLNQVAVSHDGRQMIGANSDGTVYHRGYLGAAGGWSTLAPLPSQLLGVQDIAISTGSSRYQTGDAVAQVLVVTENGDLLHRLRLTDGAWTVWGTVVLLYGGGTLFAKRCAIAVEGPSIQHAAQVCVIVSGGGLFHLIRWSDGKWSGLQAVPGTGVGRMMFANQVAMATAYDKDSTLVAVVDVNQRVQLTQRSWDNQWIPWQPIDLPKGISGQRLLARRISLVGSPETGRGQLLVQCSDGNLYHRLVDVGRPTYPWLWRQVSYPQGSPYDIRDIALGRSVASVCDPAQSVAVWTVGDLPPLPPPV